MIDHLDHSNGSSRFRRLALPGALVIVVLASGGSLSWADSPVPVEGASVDLMPPPERPDDPPGVPAKPVTGAPKAAAVMFGRFTHVQVAMTRST